MFMMEGVRVSVKESVCGSLFAVLIVGIVMATAVAAQCEVARESYQACMSVRESEREGGVM